MKVLFFGNCQMIAIKKTLNLPNNYETHHIECWTTTISQDEFNNILNDCDLIVAHVTNDVYRNKPYLTTSYIIQNKNINCKIILVCNCYFEFYHFDLTYKTFNNNRIGNPCSYHYDKMIECYINNYSIDYYIDNFVNNLELKTTEQLEKLAENNISELHNRFIYAKSKYNCENLYFIPVSEYIKQNYKDKLLFYSMNHPTKYLIQFICEHIISILQIDNNINYNIDVLNYVKCIIYKCISKNINFDLTEHLPLMNNITDVYKITQKYYEVYKELDYK